MTVNGNPIDDYSFLPSAATIHYTREYEWEQARIWADVPMTVWDELPGTPQWINPMVGGRSKSHFVVLYRMSNLIPAAGADAQARKMQRDAKKKGRN